MVWYGDSYLQFLGIPVSLKDMTDEMNEETSESNLNESNIKYFKYQTNDEHLKIKMVIHAIDVAKYLHINTIVINI